MGKFVIRQTETGYKFDLKATNGQVIATSEVYTTEAACIKGTESVAKCAATANFAETDNLWEKYNVVTGKVSVTKEYHTPPMMGWSAGVYLYCEQLLRENT